MSYNDFDLFKNAKVSNALTRRGDIYLETDKGVFILSPYGDCCAHCYVEAVEGTEALQGATILRVEDLQVPQPPQSNDCYDILEAWGHRIVTDKGICTIEMRVSHNGYYGGWMEVDRIDSIPKDAKPLEDKTGGL